MDACIVKIVKYLIESFEIRIVIKGYVVSPNKNLFNSVFIAYFNYFEIGKVIAEFTLDKNTNK